MKVVIMRAIGRGPKKQGFVWDPSLEKEFEMDHVPRVGDDIDFSEEISCTYCPSFISVIRVEWDMKRNRVIVETDSEQDSLEENEQKQFIAELRKLGWVNPYSS